MGELGTNSMGGYHTYGNALGKSKSYRSCYVDHKEFSLGGGVVVGASCSNPRSDYDIYVGFDRSMGLSLTKYPWEGGYKPQTYVHYMIMDGQPPTDANSFINLINWSVDSLKLGKSIHAGCIGGHGRTGLYLAALYTAVTGDPDSIAMIRKIHCKKAVESVSQVNFLYEHFGIRKVPASKEHSFEDNPIQKKIINKTIPRPVPKKGITIIPIKNKLSLW